MSNTPSQYSPMPWHVALGFFSPKIRDANGDIVVDEICGDEHQQANAYLLAAAPWLLKACEVQEQADRLRDAWLYTDGVPGPSGAEAHRVWQEAQGLAEDARHMAFTKLKKENER